MAKENFEMQYTRGRLPAEAGYPGLRQGKRIDEALGIICEYDVAVTMRDGIKIYADVFRPKAEGKYPVIVAWAPYGKHDFNDFYKVFHGCGQSKAEVSEYCIFEGPDPAYWCPYGYVIINVDPRGAWGSEGDLTFMTPQEAQDGYDLVEWAGTQGWSNSKVGFSGVSYLGWTQWKVAALNPPHLAAICPWEGVSDFYRELCFHGGIPCDFTAFFTGGACRATTREEDLPELAKKHALFDDYWAEKNADLSKITVPAFVVASWSDHGLHERGTLEGFKKIASKEKWLRVHGRKKWVDYYQNTERQRQFFDKFLKGIDSEVKYWPKVNLEIRERPYIGNFRGENEWPLARTQYTELFLNADVGGLSKSKSKNESQIRYRVDDTTDKTQRAQFELEFAEKTELTGHMKLKLWVEAVGSNDMDLFVVIDKIDRTGDRIPFLSQTAFDNGPAAYGWLRVSHRELDEKKSMDYQPVLKHQRELKLKTDEIVPVEIEIWPTCILFEKGEKLRVTVLGSDLFAHPWWEHDDAPAVNKGEHVIYAGGKYDSHLLVPIIPAN